MLHQPAAVSYNGSLGSPPSAPLPHPLTFPYVWIITPHSMHQHCCFHLLGCGTNVRMSQLFLYRSVISWSQTLCPCSWLLCCLLRKPFRAWSYFMAGCDAVVFVLQGISCRPRGFQDLIWGICRHMGLVSFSLMAAFMCLKHTQSL